MANRWRFRPHDEKLIADVEQMTGLSPLVAKLLVNREITSLEDAREFLTIPLSQLKDPSELHDAHKAAEIIFEHINAKKRIIIYGDYDADGMTGTAILMRCITAAGGDVGYHVPNRLEEGYGLNNDSVRTLIERGAELIITVDCGVASVEQADLVYELGAKLIVTDHHQYGEVLPQAEAIVHPSLPGVSYPHGPLCGSAVAFKVAWSLCQKLEHHRAGLSGSFANQKVNTTQKKFLMAALGLAAIGTVADVVQLVKENRTIVKHGLAALRDRPFMGMRELMANANIHEKQELGGEDIGFVIGPRINAAGRLGQAQLGVELMVTQSPDRAKKLADYIEGLNRSREKLERSVQLAASKKLNSDFDIDNDPAIVLDGKDWHQGVIGIVAGKLAERYFKPTIVISRSEHGDELAVGSCRNGGVINIHSALKKCSDHLAGWGGHAAAAGLKIADDQIDSFRSSFFETVSEAMSSQEDQAGIRVDGEAMFLQLTMNAATQIERLSPFGCGNPRPIFCTTHVRLANHPRKIGEGERHLSLAFKQGNRQIRAVAFGKGDWYDDLMQNFENEMDILYKINVNEYRGHRSVQMQMVDWRLSDEAATSAEQSESSVSV